MAVGTSSPIKRSDQFTLFLGEISGGLYEIYGLERRNFLRKESGVQGAVAAGDGRVWAVWGLKRGARVGQIHTLF